MLPPPDARLIELPSWNRTRADEGVPPVLFVYVTWKVNVVVGVPLVGETLPSVRVTVPHVAESPRTGPTKRARDAPSRTVNASAPVKTDRMCLVWVRNKLELLF